MCVRENTSQAASVEFVRHRRANYARSRLQAFCRKNPSGFSTASQKGAERLLFAACQRSLAIVQAFWYNGEKEDRREEEWNSGNRITGETW